MSDREPFDDMDASPLSTGDDEDVRTRVLDWRLLGLALVMIYVAFAAWVNWGTTVRLQLPLCLDSEVGLVWLVLLLLAVGGGAALVVQGAYRRHRARRAALEEQARRVDYEEAKAPAGEGGSHAK